MNAPTLCHHCGYALAGIPDRAGLITCPECGSPNAPDAQPDRDWHRWTFALGIAGPNYLMAGAAALARWLGDVGLATCMSIFILGLTLGLALAMSRGLSRRFRTLPARTALALVLWAALNTPPLALLWWLWK